METTTIAKVPVEALEVQASNLDPQEAARIFQEHGCLVVRGLMQPYIAEIQRDVQETVHQALGLLPEARKVTEGWITPDGTLWLPAPAGYGRAQQIMVLGLRYTTSAAFFRSALEPRLVTLMQAIIGPDIELFMDGQCLYKEPVGGHPKNLHQDSAYFEHRFMGPVAVLNYVVPTNLENGALHVVPGSHRLGTLPHVDTFSHLGLDDAQWPWESALPICGEPGDAILFHYRCIHGSKQNHSTTARPVFIHRYRRPDDYVVVGATTSEARAAGEAELQQDQRSDQARKQEQQGLMVAGFRRYEAG